MFMRLEIQIKKVKNTLKLYYTEMHGKNNIFQYRGKKNNSSIFLLWTETYLGFRNSNSNITISNFSL